MGKMYFRLEQSYSHPVSSDDFDTGAIALPNPIPYTARCVSRDRQLTVYVSYEVEEPDDVVVIMARRISTNTLDTEDEHKVASRVYKESSDNLRRMYAFALQLTCDYCGVLIPKYYFGELRIELSADNVTWYGYPPVCVIRPHIFGLSRIEPNGLSQYIRWHSLSGVPPTVGWTLLGQANYVLPQMPRAALIMAIVAFEVGIKAIIGELSPQSRWLLEELPSPPAKKLLMQFLPQLLTNPCRSPIPPQSVRKTIFEAIEYRNQLVHKPADEPSPQEAMDVIRAVDEALGIIQFARGYDSGWRHVNPQTQREYLIEQVQSVVKSCGAIGNKDRDRLAAAVATATDIHHKDPGNAAKLIFENQQHLPELFFTFFGEVATPQFGIAWEQLVKQSAVESTTASVEGQDSTEVSG